MWEHGKKLIQVLCAALALAAAMPSGSLASEGAPEPAAAETAAADAAGRLSSYDGLPLISVEVAEGAGPFCGEDEYLCFSLHGRSLSVVLDKDGSVIASTHVFSGYYSPFTIEKNAVFRMWTPDFHYVFFSSTEPTELRFPTDTHQVFSSGDAAAVVDTAARRVQVLGCDTAPLFEADLSDLLYENTDPKEINGALTSTTDGFFLILSLPGGKAAWFIPPQGSGEAPREFPDPSIFRGTYYFQTCGAGPYLALLDEGSSYIFYDKWGNQVFSGYGVVSDITESPNESARPGRYRSYYLYRTNDDLCMLYDLGQNQLGVTGGYYPTSYSGYLTGIPLTELGGRVCEGVALNAEGFVPWTYEGGRILANTNGRLLSINFPEGETPQSMNDSLALTYSTITEAYSLYNLQTGARLLETKEDDIYVGKDFYVVRESLPEYRARYTVFDLEGNEVYSTEKSRVRPWKYGMMSVDRGMYCGLCRPDGEWLLRIPVRYEE